MIQNYKSKGLKESLFFAYRLICGAAIATFLLATITACSPDKPEKTKKIHPISFTANLGDKASSKTRYTGDVNSGVERIEWLSGDKITIVYDDPEVYGYYEDAQIADYALFPIEGEKHRATIKPLGKELYWRNLEMSRFHHRFLAVYPSMSDDNEDAVGHAPYYASIDHTAGNAYFGLYVPTVQTSTYDSDASTEAISVYRPNMKNLLLVASNLPPDAELPHPISLTFYPLVTAFEFTFSGETDEEIYIESVQIKSDETSSIALSGEFFTFGGRPSFAYYDSSGENPSSPIRYLPIGDESNNYVITHLSGAILNTTKNVRATLFTLSDSPFLPPYYEYGKVHSSQDCILDNLKLIVTLRGTHGVVTRSLLLKRKTTEGNLTTQFLGFKKYIFELSIPTFKKVSVRVTDIVNPIEVGSDITSTIDVLDYDSEDDNDDILI